ncbi:MAG: exosortase/archaeosortase family protein [Acidobacteria bacterium]|nr:exosortase/archaeosortase family protein [Acidobacteriota bacterium]MBS1864953.1 exosortase/archaeosortase family protein [Acidobacteriota bacterium]
MQPQTAPGPKFAPFAGWTAICSLAFAKPLIATLGYALHNDSASHILLIPFIFAFLLYAEHRTMTRGQIDFAAAFCFLVPGVFLAVLALRPPSRLNFGNIPLSISILAFVLFVIAGFVAIYGRKIAARMSFSLAFLIFFVPIPEPILNRTIYFLQVGSADIAEWFFDLTGTPALRQGFVFHLPTISIEVAQECSGIRSSLALLILALLVAHFTFSKTWKKLLFVFAGLVIMVVKNGIRIATLTILANNVNPDFLYGHLHRDGGVVFFLVGLALLWPVYWLLRRGDRQPAPAVPAAQRAAPSRN